MSRRIAAVLTMLLGLVLVSPLVVTATQPLCELNVANCTTTTDGTTTTSEGTTTTSEGGTTSTTGETTTTPPSETTSTVVVVNPICIDCNNATSADLQQLAGVDATLAAQIIANRPYETLQDLVEKGVMTPGQLLLIIAVNLNTGAFAGPECLSFAVPSTSSSVGESTTTTDPVLPVTGQESAPLGLLASGLMGFGLLLLGWRNWRMRDDSRT